MDSRMPGEPPAPPDASEEKVHGVAEITRGIKATLEQQFAALWVEGELFNLKRHSSGHWYFSLRDGNAQLSGVMFRSAARRVRFAAADGLRVQCHGRITVYEPRGQYQIVVDQMRPAGVGVLLQALEDLKRKLSAEGLFATERKRPLPYLPRRVGIVTSPTGAAVRDMLRILHDRFPVPVLIYPAAVQGAAAVPRIVEGIRALDAVDDVDVLIVGRGGGSLEDLWAFNEEPVARALAACRTPTVSAVGHEVDFLLSDMVADVRAPTPTGAAEMVVPAFQDLEFALDDATERLERALRRQIRDCRVALEHRVARVPHPRRALEERSQRLDEATRRLSTATRNRVHQARSTLELAQHRLRLSHPRRRVDANRDQLTRLTQRLAQATTRRLERGRAELERARSQLRALGPQQVLDRGYSIVRDPQSGDVIRRAKDAKSGAALRVMSAEGEYDVVVGKAARKSRKKSAEPQKEQGDLFG